MPRVQCQKHRRQTPRQRPTRPGPLPAKQENRAERREKWQRARRHLRKPAFFRAIETISDLKRDTGEDAVEYMI